MPVWGGGFRGIELKLTLTLVTTAAVAIVWLVAHPPLCELVQTFLTLEGTALLAAAFTPSGGPRPVGWRGWIDWFRDKESAKGVRFDQPAFYGGLLCLYVATVLGAF